MINPGKQIIHVKVGKWIILETMIIKRTDAVPVGYAYERSRYRRIHDR